MPNFTKRDIVLQISKETGLTQRVLLRTAELSRKGK